MGRKHPLDDKHSAKKEKTKKRAVMWIYAPDRTWCKKNIIYSIWNCWCGSWLIPSAGQRWKRMWSKSTHGWFVTMNLDRNYHSLHLNMERRFVWHTMCKMCKLSARALQGLRLCSSHQLTLNPTSTTSTSKGRSRANAQSGPIHYVLHFWYGPPHFCMIFDCWMFQPSAGSQSWTLQGLVRFTRILS